MFLITDAVTEAKEGTYQNALQATGIPCRRNTFRFVPDDVKAVENCVTKGVFHWKKPPNGVDLSGRALKGQKSFFKRGYNANIIVFDNQINTIAHTLGKLI